MWNLKQKFKCAKVSRENSLKSFFRIFSLGHTTSLLVLPCYVHFQIYCHNSQIKKNHYHKGLFIKPSFEIIMSLCPLFHPLNISYPQKNQFLHKGVMKNNKFPNLLTCSLTNILSITVFKQFAPIFPLLHPTLVTLHVFSITFCNHFLLTMFWNILWIIMNFWILCIFATLN